VIPLKAIAAMSLNRVIGNGNQIPWHLPEDFKWFKATTTGHVIVMGRKTFESIGKPLPNRETIVLSRLAFSHPGVKTIRSLDELPDIVGDRQVFICGGAQIYEQTLPLCSELFLTLVKREVEGDASSRSSRISSSWRRKFATRRSSKFCGIEPARIGRIADTARPAIRLRWAGG
jgi:dihydrofolate reductase